MIRRTLILLIALVAGIPAYCEMWAAGGDTLTHNVSANQEYRMLVYDSENNPLELTGGKSLSATRGFFGDIFGVMKASYSSTAIGIISNASSDLLTNGVGLLVEALRSKKGDWLQQVRQDCSFTKQLPMQEDIINFYGNRSTKSALDPDSIVFNGFGCQQFLKYVDEKGDTLHLLVFDVKCSLRQDDYGKSRMLNHGKFEVLLDRVIFNPYLCNLPNDSVTEQNIKECRTQFDFDRRKNLKFQITAEVLSSWVNEAIQITQDQKLGEFVVSAVIPDSSYLETDGEYVGCFVYERPGAEDTNLTKHDLNDKTAGQVSVVGDCFLVPRSYIGCDNERGDNRTWGTGQYKLNMTLSESCDVNMDFYYDDKPQKVKGKKSTVKEGDNEPMESSQSPMMAGDNQKHHWNYHWSEEWKKIKRRKQQSNNIFSSILKSIKLQYSDNKWINVLVDPVITTVLEKENSYLTTNLNKWLQVGSTMSGASSGTPSVSVSSGGTSSSPAATPTGAPE